MAGKNALVVFCRSYQIAEKAVRTFQAAHFNIQKVSVIGRDSFDVCDLAEASPPNGNKPVPDESAFWARLWQLLPGDAFLRIKGIGPIIVSGPISQKMREAGTNPESPHACGPLRTCMLAIGISSDRLHSCESALHSGHFLVVIYGSPRDVRAAEDILKTSSGRTKTQDKQMDLMEQK